LELFNDILTGISREASGGAAKPTRVAHIANMSYDKLAKYLGDLESRRMITVSPLELTDRGRSFLRDYNKIRDFVVQMKLDYVGEGGASI